MKKSSELLKIMMMKYTIGKFYLKDIFWFCYWYSTTKKRKTEKADNCVAGEMAQ